MDVSPLLCLPNAGANLRAAARVCFKICTKVLHICGCCCGVRESCFASIIIREAAMKRLMRTEMGLSMRRFIMTVGLF